jgi:hypothetical protein
MNKFAVLVALIFSLGGCAFNEQPCEDVVDISEQLEQCQQLQRKIMAAKDQTFIRSELERRYQEDCVELRFYRDEHKDGVCQNKQAVNELKKEVIKNGQQPQPKQ